MSNLMLRTNRRVFPEAWAYLRGMPSEVSCSLAVAVSGRVSVFCRHKLYSSPSSLGANHLNIISSLDNFRRISRQFVTDTLAERECSNPVLSSVWNSVFWADVNLKSQKCVSVVIASSLWANIVLRKLIEVWELNWKSVVILRIQRGILSSIWIYWKFFLILKPERNSKLFGKYWSFHL